MRTRGLVALRHLGLLCIPFLLAAAPLLSFDAAYPLLRSASYPEGEFPYQVEEMTVRGLAGNAPK